MFRKKVIEFILGVLMIGNCSASVNFMNNEETDVFAESVRTGRITEDVAIATINAIPTTGITPETVVKNLFTTSLFIRGTTTVEASILLKQIEIARGVEMPDMDGVSNNLKITRLLMLSQLSEDKRHIVEKPDVGVIRTVIDRLGKAVNGDITKASTLLSEFYDVLIGSAYSDYVPQGYK